MQKSDGIRVMTPRAIHYGGVSMRNKTKRTGFLSAFCPSPAWVWEKRYRAENEMYRDLSARYAELEFENRTLKVLVAHKNSDGWIDWEKELAKL